MTRLDYSRNHSRSLSNGRRYYGDEPVFVTCLICHGLEPADGKSAVRAEAERGVKARMSYHGPPQVWLCRTCVETYGTLVTRDLAEQLLDQAGQVPEQVLVELPEPVPDDGVEPQRSFWKWALAAGVAILVGWAILGQEDPDIPGGEAILRPR